MCGITARIELAVPIKFTSIVSANAKAHARPIPRAAPVTMTTFSLNRSILLSQIELLVVGYFVPVEAGLTLSNAANLAKAGEHPNYANTLLWGGGKASRLPQG